MIIKYALAILCVCAQLCAFTEKPWFAEPFASEGSIFYAYQYYPSIANQKGAKYSSNNNYLQGDVSLAFFDNLDVEAEVQFDATRRRSFGFESIGASIRKGLLNDLSGDFLSVAVGANLRIVPPNRLVDPSTPYHNVANLEATLSIGREWNDYFDWYYRSWCLFAVGEANKGYPWIRIDYHFTGKVQDTWEWDLFGLGYFGTGGYSKINVHTFRGYYNVAHESIDLGVSVAYLLGLWGKINLSGAFRVYAKSYPQAATTVMLSYTLPFSFF